tara:strand:+ start:202 stop:471 length:270 start_codon:yes stop_codon:yes gene_type:complete
MDYLNNLKRSLTRIPTDRLDAMHKELKTEYYENKRQFDALCELCLEGFDRFPEWERERAEKAANNSRQDWFLRTELAWASLQSFEEATK